MLFYYIFNTLAVAKINSKHKKNNLSWRFKARAL